MRTPLVAALVFSAACSPTPAMQLSGPVAVVVVAPVSQVAGGSLHSCILRNGAVRCWGDNSRHQLGVAQAGPASTPIDVPGLSSGVTAISAGAFHTCAVQNGGVQCWGTFRIDGHLDQGAPSLGGAQPTPVPNLASGVTAISSGAMHACAIQDGAARCWGYGQHGELGDGTPFTNGSIDALSVATLTSGVTQIAAGKYVSCASKDAAVYCWGENQANQSFFTGDTNTPVAVQVFSGAAEQLSIRDATPCALGGGTLQCWGADVAPGYREQPIPYYADIDRIASGILSTCTLIEGGVYCFGDNSLGQLGNAGPSHTFDVPVAVDGLTTGVTQIGSGEHHACAFLANGGLQCWGGAPVNSATPIPIQ